MEQKIFQASAPPTVHMAAEDFSDCGKTTVFWLSGAGVMINSRGTVILIDPVLFADQEIDLTFITSPVGIGDDDPLHRRTFRLVDPPILPEEIHTLDAVLYTHSDDDHFGHITARALGGVANSFHGTHFMQHEMEKLGLPKEKLFGHGIHKTFQIGCMTITLTPADHGYQKDHPERYDWCFGPEDCCGFLIDTPDGRIWVPGDSRLMEEHLKLEGIDLMCIDFSADRWHWGWENSRKLVNHMPDTDLILIHYGTIYAPLRAAYNFNPADVKGKIANEERLHVLAPGEKYTLARKK